jgi:hypothetical protein
MVLAAWDAGPFPSVRTSLVEEPVAPADETDRRAVAARVRSLLAPGDFDLSANASRLRVDEASLRSTIDVDSPLPSMDVLVAVIREYGVDATWLLTGDYDPGTHRRIAEADRAETIEVVKDVARRHETPLNVVAIPDPSANADLPLPADHAAPRSSE